MRYTIKTIQGLAANTVITNTANIYFDQNASVATNTTTNTMVYVIPTSILESSIENGNVIIYPNPFDETALLKLSNPANELYTLCIFNTLGENVRSLSVNSGELLIRKENLAPGIYFYKLKNISDTNSFSGKFVIK